MHNNAKDNKLLSAWSRLIVGLLLLCLGALPQAGAATYLGTATVYQGGDPARVINIVYVPLGFTDNYLYPAFTDSTVPYTSQFLTSYTPFTSYQASFNIYRLDAYSTVDEEQALRTMAIQNLPNVDVIIFVLRDSNSLVIKCGGDPNVLACARMGGDVYIHFGTYMDVLAHELGHAIGYLADEYVYPAYCVIPFFEPDQINATINTDRATLKWRDWLGIDGVDLFHGALYCSTGVYRPRETCRMGAYDGWSPQQPFDPVCREGLIRAINGRVYPFVSLTPSNQFQFNLSPQPKTFSAVPDLNIRPQGVAYQYEWYFNNQLIPGATSTSYTLDLSTLTPGQTHTLRIVPVDPDINDFVRIADLGKPAAIETGWFISVAATAPTISSFTPTSGGAGIPVTISGSNFTGATAVKFNGTASQFQVINSTQINGTVPSGATTGKITVTTPVGTATSAGTFTVTPTLPAPTISSISPSSGAVGTLVNINGANFCFNQCSLIYGPTKTETRLTLNGIPIIPSLVLTTMIQFTVPAGATTGALSVTTPGGTVTSTQAFTVIVSPPPTISSFNPTIGLSGTQIAITGTNYTGTTAVAFNGAPASFSVISPTQINATVPSGVTTGPITVATSNGTTTSSQTFTVGTPPIPPPAISSFSPASGAVGTSVNINGSYFCNNQCMNTTTNTETVIKLNGVTVTPSLLFPGYIQLSLPAGATTGKLTITTPGGTATSAGTFTVIPAPTIVSFSPASGAVGTSVNINGSYFCNNQCMNTTTNTETVIKLNGVTVTPSLLFPGYIQLSLPAGATTGKLTITTPGGTATSAGTFTVMP